MRTRRRLSPRQREGVGGGVGLPRHSEAKRAFSLPVRSVWSRELAELVQRPPALLLKLAYPVVVCVPLVWSAAPSFYASMAITMVAATLAGLGTGAVMARERASGLQLRYRLLSRPAGRILLERVVASASVDMVQILPLLAVVAVIHRGHGAWWPAVLLTMAGALLAANTLGAFASSLAASAGEVMLWVMLPLLPAFYLSGLFVPATGPMAVVARLLPFSYLHDALGGAMGGRPALGPLACAGAGLGFAVLSAAAAWAAGRRVLEAEP